MQRKADEKLLLQPPGEEKPRPHELLSGPTDEQSKAVREQIGLLQLIARHEYAVARDLTRDWVATVDVSGHVPRQHGPEGSSGNGEVASSSRPEENPFPFSVPRDKEGKVRPARWTFRRPNGATYEGAGPNTMSFDLVVNPWSWDGQRLPVYPLSVQVHELCQHQAVHNLVQQHEKVLARAKEAVEEQVKQEGENGEAARASGAFGVGRGQRGILGGPREKSSKKLTKVQQLQLEQKALTLQPRQQALRAAVFDDQMEINLLQERQYRKVVRAWERSRQDMVRETQKRVSAEQENHWTEFRNHRKALQDEWGERATLLQIRNRGVGKTHRDLLEEHMKRLMAQDDDRAKRLKALQANDIEAYKSLLEQAQGMYGGLNSEADKNYQKLSDFLKNTEKYIEKLGASIGNVKLEQEKVEAQTRARREAKSRGLNEEEQEEAAAAAVEAVVRMAEADEAGTSASHYYANAHSQKAIVSRQPSILKAGALREYQLVGLSWMASLYRNRLNGILADEMGLGKTVQAMALVAWLHESEQNYGPHLIIVPNAVMVNWRAEFKTWLPQLKVVFFVGEKTVRHKLYQDEVLGGRFNCLVTTYDFAMRDRSKLQRIKWKYIIIDEAQRLKDSESKLSQAVIRFNTQRRLLLTGTPLQNELGELWALLNLLMPDVFNSGKDFAEWFGSSKAKPGEEEDDWIANEKKVIVISRLHQILEPFMLRRLVENVEGRLPPKVITPLRCPFSAYQSLSYDWLKYSSTLKLDPSCSEALPHNKRPQRYHLALQNKCMELRKMCNHPALCYTPERGGAFPAEQLLTTCGKLWMLDRVLVKLKRAGHRVLLFSTMTRLLDILEHDYLKNRAVPGANGLELMQYRRIDGMTPLEQREIAISEYNAPGSEVFIFLLSIRAAGRGLNLQSADTVVIYDPDPNPKNEDQAIARAHRIGQKREVRVLHLEAVADMQRPELPPGVKPVQNRASTGKWDETWAGAGYSESIESLVRNTIQKQKIEMADEVINAGQFDQKASQTDRREALEKLLADENRSKAATQEVLSMRELNDTLARSPEERIMFEQMDGEPGLWPAPLMQVTEVPEWLVYSQEQLDAVIAAQQKPKPGSIADFQSVAALHENADGAEAYGRGARGASRAKRGERAIYDDDDDEAFDRMLRTASDGEEEEVRRRKRATAAAAKGARLPPPPPLKPKATAAGEEVPSKPEAAADGEDEEEEEGDFGEAEEAADEAALQKRGTAGDEDEDEDDADEAKTAKPAPPPPAAPAGKPSKALSDDEMDVDDVAADDGDDEEEEMEEADAANGKRATPELDEDEDYDDADLEGAEGDEDEPAAKRARA